MSRFVEYCYVFVTILVTISGCAAIEWQTSADAYWAHNCDFSARDIGSVEGPGATCSASCGKTAACTHFAWSPYKGGTCWMKSLSGISKSQAVVYGGTSVCGIMRSSGMPVQAVVHKPASANSCDRWELTEKPVVGDWSIVQTAARLVNVDETDPGGNYEMWGYLEAKYSDYKLARHQFGTAKESTHKVCEISEMGGNKNWAAEIAGLAVVAGLAVATGGSSLIVQAGASALGGLGGTLLNTQGAAENCEDGTLGLVWYPVSIGVDTARYNFKMEVVEDDTWLSKDETYYIDTKRFGDNWSQLDECFGNKFKAPLIKGKSCSQTVDLLGDRRVEEKRNGPFVTRTRKLGRVVLESVIIAHVKGPVVDGEIQVPGEDDSVVVERKSEYGTLSAGCLF